jgi:hypothetical protein
LGRFGNSFYRAISYCLSLSHAGLSPAREIPIYIKAFLKQVGKLNQLLLILILILNFTLLGCGNVKGDVSEEPGSRPLAVNPSFDTLFSAETTEVTVSGGLAPYTITKISGLGIFEAHSNSFSYTAPVETELAQFKVLDSKGQQVTTTLQVVPRQVSTPVAVLTGLPPSYANISSLNIQVAGSSVAQYRYAIIAGGGQCDGNTTYSNLKLLSEPITDTLAIDQQYRICVLGVDSKNLEQLRAEPTEYSFVRDTTPPSAPSALVDGVSSANSNAAPTAQWSAAVDSGSGLAKYQIAIGTSLGNLDNIKAWTDIGTVTSATIGGLTLVNGTTYYTSIRAVDQLGLQSPVVTGDGWVMASLVPANFAKAMGGTEYDRIVDVAVDGQGYIYAVGSLILDSAGGTSGKDFMNHNILGKTTASTSHGFITKIAPSGAPVWIKYLAGETTNWFKYESRAVAVDSNGNVYATGVFDTTSTTDFIGNPLTAAKSVFIVKLNSDGVQQWIKTMSGSDPGEGLGIATSPSGDVYAVGVFRNDLSNSRAVTDFADQSLAGKSLTPYNDGYLAKLDSNGVQQWIKVLGGWRDDVIQSVAVDSNSNVYVGGYFYNDNANVFEIFDFGNNPVVTSSVSANRGAFVAKLNSSGTQSWLKTFNGGVDINETNYWLKNISENVNDIAVTASGDIYVVGNYANNSIDSFEAKDFGGGQIFGRHGSWTLDAYVAKLLPNGDQAWIRSLGGAGEDTAMSVATDSSGNVYISGTVSDMPDSALNAKTFGDNSIVGKNDISGQQDAYFTKLNSSGVEQNFWLVGGGHTDIGFGIAVDSLGAIIMGGFIQNDSANSLSVTDQSSANLLGISSSTADDAFILRYLPP